MALMLPILEIAGVAKKLAGTRACASGRVKDPETRVGRDSDPLRRLAISPLFSTPLLCVSSPPSPSLREKQERDGGGDKGDYYVNMGYAIRTLREELPEMFYREPCFDIYRDDVVFKDPVNAFTGIDNYKLIFSALRFSGQLCFKALWVEIVSIWQPMENIIMIRWIAHGILRVPWERRRRLDGTSEYKLDKNGKIFEHRVDNVALNSPPKFKVQAVEEMIQSLGCPSTPKPTFFKALFSPTPWMFVTLRFTWQQLWQESPTSMSLNDVSVECSKSFVNALQELKSLRPQLYSAAEYCEKSYLHNEEKYLVLDNLKDYVVRALVNSVDHLGTVANKLTDLYEQQRIVALTLELNVSCLNQRILTSQTYTDVEGLRKQQTLASIIRHQKHYILPDSLSRMAQKSPNQQINVAQTGAPTQSIGDPDAHSTASAEYRLPDREKAASASPSSLLSYPKSATLTPISNVVSQRFDVRNPPGVLKPLTPFRSFDNSKGFELHRRPRRSKRVLASLFGKTKSSKQKKLSDLM